MATIRTAIQVHDGMTPGLKAMTNALNMTVSSFEALQTASGNAIDSSSVQAARAELNKAEMAFDEIEQEIKQANEAQQQFNNSVQNGQGAAGGLLSKIKNIAVTMGAAFSVKKVIGLSDEMTQTTARLDMMNDGLQTTGQLQDMIFQSAQRSRGAYQSTADAVAKMGILAKDAFSSNNEAIAFVEQLNKQFTISGTSAMGIDAAMLQLTQAMGQGVLRGEELNSVFEQAPTIIQSIADYLDIPIGQVRNIAQEGKITADVVKNAMFAAADETNAKFEQMPMTFSQVGTILGNTLLQTFEPVIQGIGRGAQLIYDNWSTLEPIFWGLVTAVGAYAAITAVSNAVTWLGVAANRELITTLLSNPALWIALTIGVLIGMIYKWVQSVGGLEIAWKIAMNGIMTAWDWVQIGFFTGVYWVLDLWNKLQLGAMTASVGIQNFMGDMKAGVLNILQNMVNGAIGIINDFINILNKIPGVSIEAVQEVTFGTTAQLENDAAKIARQNELKDYRTQIEAGMAERDASLEQMKVDARSATSQRQNEISATSQRQNEISAMQAAQAAKAAQDNDFSSIFDNADSMGHIADTAGNTARMADTMDASEEDLKYLRDLAEQEAINRYTTADINVDMSGMQNIVNNDMDLDGVVDYLGEGVYEAMEIAAEGGV